MTHYAAFTIFRGNRGRAEVVVEAIKHYRTKYHKYPDDLARLVPEFIPSIKKPKPIGLLMSNYYYAVLPEEKILFFYTVIPPFGRSTYNFEKDAWVYID